MSCEMVAAMRANELKIDLKRSDNCQAVARACTTASTGDQIAGRIDTDRIGSTGSNQPAPGPEACASIAAQAPAASA